MVFAVGAADSVQFNYRLPQVDERSANSAQYDFNLSVALKDSAGKVVSQKKQVKSRSVDREIKVLEVSGDRPLKVEVKYGRVSEDKHEGEANYSNHSFADRGFGDSLPIENKTYLVERRGIPLPLQVTSASGETISNIEHTLVAGNMDSVGHRNQLGRFLHGKTVKVGETLQLPKEMAAELLGMREANGDAQKLELKLTGVHEESGRKLADFATTLLVKIGSTSTLDLTGSMQIDIDTCRIFAADFAGTISSHDAQADHGQVVDVVADGTLKVAIKSQTVR